MNYAGGKAEEGDRVTVASRKLLADADLGGRYVDVQLIRAGDRFAIFAAREAETGRVVALKVPEQRAGWLYEVLHTEGEILAATCEHPNVITLHEQISLADGRPALVLERCRGPLLDALHGDEPMSLQDVVATGIKLAGALETVHRAGVLHCDVRPRNVLISEPGEPVLAGFDSAMYAANAAGHPPLHLLTAHTAPELLEGADPTRASDVYGLASTLYELISGRAAFRAYVGESPASLVVRVLSSTVAPIAHRDVPLEISDLLTWALSPEPADRPPSPAWIAEELARLERREGWPRTRLIAS